MRNRETEWTYPMMRFLGSFFIPPLLIALITLGIFATEVAATFDNFFFGFLQVAYETFFITTLPAIIFFLGLEKVYETKSKARDSRLRFALYGGLIGLAFTGVDLVIGLVRENPLDHLGLAALGPAVGFATAAIIYPTTRYLPSEEESAILSEQP